MWSKKRIIIGLGMISVILGIAILTACGSSSSGTPSTGPIGAKSILPQVSGDVVTIPLSEVQNNTNTQFKLATVNGNKNFMAYVFEGEIQVRANVCPPCGSIGYTLDNGILVCNTCGTRFKAKTGDGVSGACVAYPKAAIAYQVSDGNIVMSGAEMVTAYNNTLQPNWP